MEPERFQVHWISGSEGAKFARVVTRIHEQISALGPNQKLRKPGILPELANALQNS